MLTEATTKVPAVYSFMTAQLLNPERSLVLLKPRMYNTTNEIN